MEVILSQGRNRLIINLNANKVVLIGLSVRGSENLLLFERQISS